MLAGAYKLSETKLKEYEAKAKELLSEKKSTELHDAVAKQMRDVPLTEKTEIAETGTGDLLCFDTFSGRYFRSSAEAIHAAESKLNKALIGGEFVQINDLYYELGLMPLKYGDRFGWEAYGSGVAPVDIKLTYEAQEFNGKQEAVCILDYHVTLDDRNFCGRL